MSKIRPATDAERRQIAERWVRCIEPQRTRVLDPASGRKVRIPAADRDSLMGTMYRAPRGKIAPSLWRMLARQLVEALLPSSHALVLTSDAVDEPVGWAVFDAERLHFVYVLGDARLRGVARSLVRAAFAQAGATLRPTYSTESGRALMLSVARLQAARNDMTNAPARPLKDAHGHQVDASMVE